MFSRPSLRAVLATTTAAALLVGGANLASYASTHHGHGTGASAAKSSQPKTITFTLGSNQQSFAANTSHLFTAKVPKGTYATSISGFVSGVSGTDNNSYTCLLVDKKALLHLVHSASLAGTQRLYSAAEQSGADNNFGFGLITDHNPVAKVDRTTILYGCVFDGADPFTVARPIEFTLTPVKASHQKGHKFVLPTAKVRDLAHALR